MLVMKPSLMSLVAMALGLSVSAFDGCTGPLAHRGTIYMGRTVLARATADVEHLHGIPVKEAATYSVRQYVFEGTCTLTDPSGCRVVMTDLGRMVLAAPDHLLEIQYRGNIIVPAELAVEINQNSTLRTLSVQDSSKDHTFYVHFGDQGTGMK